MKKMKKKIFAALLAVLVVAGALAGCGGAKLTMCTGVTSGTYYAFGGVLSE